MCLSISQHSLIQNIRKKMKEKRIIILFEKWYTWNIYKYARVRFNDKQTKVNTDSANSFPLFSSIVEGEGYWIWNNRNI